MRIKTAEKVFAAAVHKERAENMVEIMTLQIGLVCNEISWYLQAVNDVCADITRFSRRQPYIH